MQPHPSQAITAAFARIVAELSADGPRFDPDGSCFIGLVDPGPAERVLERLPGEWCLAALRESEDATSAVIVCSEERGVMAFCDHFQAGLFGHVTVYPDVGSYEAAEAAAIAQYTVSEEPYE